MATETMDDTDKEMSLGNHVSRHGLTEEEDKEFEEFHKSLGLVSSFTKQMVKLAIDQLRPEFERMAGRAAERALDSKMMKVKEIQDELNRKEKELHQLRLEKKIIQSKLDKEKQQNVKSQQAMGSMEQKEKEIRKLEAEIHSMKTKLRKKADELKRERDRATIEESKRLELESSLQSNIDKLRKELDKVKGQLGQIRSAKNVGDEETKKLRERERQLLEEIEELKSQSTPRKRRNTNNR
ncbi:centrosomal protein of 83 kDa-like [Ruditapes philippinarum]|uniref:centrosomal protein of 83 kDa-like n=1 Tax=Ruditapes philippinarum TaxID=129788 RepID=UPI00295BCA9A|nr:centrosomal protein of 83 kDa-like [Ruditapes philippinarum]